MFWLFYHYICIACRAYNLFPKERVGEREEKDGGGGQSKVRDCPGCSFKAGHIKFAYSQHKNGDALLSSPTSLELG